jgi:hypothetical protein
LLIGCSPEHEIITSCEDQPGIRAVCAFQNPEDLADPGGGSPLIVSQMGSMTDSSRRGSLALFDLSADGVRVAYPGSRTEAVPPAPGWGDAECPGELLAEINPHGIDLATLADGRRRLLVVNHGSRESIEFFEVTGEGAALELAWRGCAVPPEGLFFNDVVSLSDGALLATHMMSGNPMWGFVRASFGFDTGAVYEWRPDAGWRVVPGTEAPFPNGIELSADERDIFLNVYATGEVRRISRETGELLAMAEISRPDNSSWSSDGRLLVASHVGGMADQMQCQDLVSGACPLAFEIVSLDPISLEGSVVFANAGEPMGAGTVALDLGDELVIGSFSGDRIIRVGR